jgi:hypothetical protein
LTITKSGMSNVSIPTLSRPTMSGFARSSIFVISPLIFVRS